MVVTVASVKPKPTIWKAALVTGLSALMVSCVTPGGELIDERGGMVVSDDGQVILEIPEDALDEPTYIEIEALPQVPDEGVSAVYEMRPHTLTLSIPARVTYDFSRVPNDAKFDWVWAVQRDGEWLKLHDQEVDLDVADVTARTGYLARIAVMDRSGVIRAR